MVYFVATFHFTDFKLIQSVFCTRRVMKTATENAGTRRNVEASFFHAIGILQKLMEIWIVANHLYIVLGTHRNATNETYLFTDEHRIQKIQEKKKLCLNARNRMWYLVSFRINSFSIRLHWQSVSGNDDDDNDEDQMKTFLF